MADSRFVQESLAGAVSMGGVRHNRHIPALESVSAATDVDMISNSKVNTNNTCIWRDMSFYAKFSVSAH